MSRISLFERATRELLYKPKAKRKARPQPSLPKLKFLEKPMPSDIEVKRGRPKTDRPTPDEGKAIGLPERRTT
jgi:hypothetical protein